MIKGNGPRGTAGVPRPARERGRKRVDGMAYQRALAVLRDRHREEFEELRAHHLARLQAEQTEGASS